MIVHLYYKQITGNRAGAASKAQSVETNRISWLPNSPYLTLGTRPLLKEIILNQLEWFWIEED